MLSILSTFAQYGSDFNYTTTYNTVPDQATVNIISGIMLIIDLLILALFVVPAIISWWKLFEKAHKPGWAALIPIYNWFTIVEIAEVPTWYFAMLFIPFANIIFYFLIIAEVSKKYSNPATIWLTAFLPLIALFMVSKTEYIGAGAAPGAAPGYPTPPAPQVVGGGQAPASPFANAPQQPTPPQPEYGQPSAGQPGFAPQQPQPPTDQTPPPPQPPVAGPTPPVVQ